MRPIRHAVVTACLCLIGFRIAAAATPPGFQETTVVSGIFSITAFDWTPDGDLWILSKGGNIWRLPAGGSTPSVARALSVDATGERGLLGLAIDPAFAVNHFIYLYYTASTTPARNRVSRFTVVGGVPTNEMLLLQGPDLVSAFHNAGSVGFGADGMLYVSMGDNQDGANAPRLDRLQGKLLRIAPDGSIPPSNPFVSDPSARHEIFAAGFRNPWRFSVDPLTGNLYVGDVGQASYEELDLILPGADYGWPATEGPFPAGVSGVTYPVYAYGHNGGSASITAGVFMTSGNFPATYIGNYFFGDYALNKIVRLVFDASGQPALSESFATSTPGPVHLRVGPDAALWYASNNFGQIRRVAWVGGGNGQPTAVAGATPSSGLAPLQVQFSSAGSSDPEMTPLSYNWVFGDGGTSTAPNPTHSYVAGAWTATLTVSDGQLTDSATIRIVSGNREPSASIVMPAPGSRFSAGETLAYSGTGSDPDDGALGGSSFSWTILFHHQTHLHPYLGPISGSTFGEFEATDVGETSPDVWYEVLLTVTDSGSALGAAGALSKSVSVAVLPNLSTMSFQTSPRPDLPLTLDGQPLATPATVDGVVGMQRLLGAPSPQTPGDGHTYQFSSWSDGGAASHAIATPSSNTTFVATYVCDVLAEVPNVRAAAAGGQVTLSWEAPADPCLASGGTAYRVYVATSARPSSPPGSFPADPSFTLRGTTGALSLTFTAPAPVEFYLVVPVGSDGSEGPVGSYGS